MNFDITSGLAARGYVPGSVQKRQIRQVEYTDALSEQLGEVESGFVLHYFDDTEGKKAISAVALGDGSSVTVYKPEDYSAANPEYIVKYWDKTGKSEEEVIRLNEVNAENATYLEMYAYSCYLEQTGLTEHALSSFMMAVAAENVSIDDLNDRHNYKKDIETFMQEQLESRNWNLYLNEKELFEALETHANQSRTTPFDKFMNKGTTQYSYLADESGVIQYNGVTIMCDKNAITIGDMSNENDVITIPLSGGGVLKVNRSNKDDLAKAIGMFSPEDVKIIMSALAADNKIQEMENEIEDDKNSIGDKDTKVFQNSDAYKDMWNKNFAGASQTVENVWKETMEETGIDGFGFDESGKLTHLSQFVVQRLLLDKGKSVLGGSVESALTFAGQAIEKIAEELNSLIDRAGNVRKAYEDEQEFLSVFVEKLQNI
jgi:hypothetical protein